VTAVEADVSVEAGLARYDQITRAAMAEYLEGAAYALRDANGWLDELVREYPARGGKAIRPALCLATCVAFGGTVEEALPSAVAIELMHNAFLVHDDIEDGSTLRRGQPTLHQRHGTPLALNAGDALVVRAAAPLRENRRLLGGRMASQVSDEFERMAQHTVGGQATELGWRRDNVVDLGPDDYLDLIMRKTCWYTTIHPLRIGALIGSWGSADLDHMVRFGFHLGAAFQIRDDLLNLEGDEDVYGKEWCGDLYEGKRTLMLIHLLSTAASTERSAVVAFLAKRREERTASEVADVLALMKAYGSLDFARAFGEGIASAADDGFEEAFADVPDSEERAFVHAMIGWMLSRTS
jgi:geranylgeranyl diphosphate synthase type II